MAASYHVVAAIREFGTHQRKILSLSLFIIPRETSKLSSQAALKRCLMAGVETFNIERLKVSRYSK